MSKWDFQKEPLHRLAELHPNKTYESDRHLWTWVAIFCMLATLAFIGLWRDAELEFDEYKRMYPPPAEDAPGWDCNIHGNGRCGHGR